MKLLLEFDDPENVFDFVESFNVESLEIDISEATKMCCRSYELALKDLLGHQPNLKHLKVIGSHNFPHNDLFNENISHKSTPEKIHYQLKSLHYSARYSKREPSDDVSFESIQITNYPRIKKNIKSFLINNGLQIQELHLEHPEIKTSEIIFMLQNLKQLKLLKLSLHRIVNDEIALNFYNLTQTLGQLENLKKLHLMNNCDMNPTKCQFLKLLLSKSPELTEIQLIEGYFGEMVPIWLTKFNTKLTTINDAVDLVSNDMFKMRKLQSLQTLMVTKGLFVSFNHFYRVLSNITAFVKLNPTIAKLVFNIHEIAESNTSVCQSKLENFINVLADKSSLTELVISFSSETSSMQKGFVELLTASMELSSHWKCLREVNLRTDGSAPIALWTSICDESETVFERTESDIDSDDVSFVHIATSTKMIKLKNKIAIAK